jgi:hypothetical protein
MALFQVIIAMPQLAQTGSGCIYTYNSLRASSYHYNSLSTEHSRKCFSVKKKTSRHNLYVVASKEVPGIRWYDLQEFAGEFTGIAA